MKVHTQYDPIRDRVNVYVNVGGDQWLDGDSPRPVQVVEGGNEVPCYISMPSWVAKELKLALDGRPEPASNRHLDDALAVRDRLLAMVEERWSE